MFWIIMGAFAFLTIATGHSMVPNEIMTFTWWTIIIAYVIWSLIFGLETKEHHKSRNFEESEWYLRIYKAYWFDPIDTQWKINNFCFEAQQGIYKNNSYRARKYLQVAEDLKENYRRKYIYNLPLIDTYKRTYDWMAINQVDNPLYDKRYQGIVNDEEKLKAWEPSMEINLG